MINKYVSTSLHFLESWCKSGSNYTAHRIPQIDPNTCICKKFSLLYGEPHMLILLMLWGVMYQLFSCLETLIILMNQVIDLYEGLGMGEKS